MLSIESAVAGYDGSRVLHQVSLTVEAGEVVSVIGRNGAGKSTLMKVATGLLECQAGSVSVDGRRLTGRGPRASVQAGVALVPEGRQMFAGLSVRDNLDLGAYGARDRGISLKEVLDLFPALEPLLEQRAGTLSGGQQQMVAIGRGLMSRPRYLLLDEPSLGLAPAVMDRIFEAVDALRGRGIGILLVEQNGRAALAMSDRGVLLEEGRVIMEGPATDLLNDPHIIERYLGMGGESAAVGSDEAVGAALRRALGQACPQ